MAYKDPEKKKAYAARWYAANKERTAATTAAWYASNKERKAATDAAWYAANKERKAATDAAWYAVNKERAANTRVAWYAVNKERRAATERARLYKMVAGDYERMLAGQANRCAICGEPFDENRKPVVEHCHDTGIVRGLAHSVCNSGIGKLGDSAHRVMLALRYLLKSGQRLAEPHILTTNLIAGLTDFAASLPA